MVYLSYHTALSLLKTHIQCLWMPIWLSHLCQMVHSGIDYCYSFRQEISATNLLTMATGNFCFGSKSTFTFWNHLKWNSWQPKIRTQQCLYKHWNAFLMCNKIYIRCIRGNNVFTFRVHCHTKDSKFFCTRRHMLLIDVIARGSIRSVDNVYHRIILNACFCVLSPDFRRHLSFPAIRFTCSFFRFSHSSLLPYNVFPLLSTNNSLSTRW